MESLYPFDSTGDRATQSLSSTIFCFVQYSSGSLWLREVNKDITNPPSGPTIIVEDNQSAICMSKNPQFHGRSKHINIQFHFIQEQVTANNICLKYSPSEDMVTDLLTK